MTELYTNCLLLLRGYNITVQNQLDFSLLHFTKRLRREEP